MAEFGTQDGGPILADDLMRDRARQFVEFLDDDVRSFRENDNQEADERWADSSEL